MSKALAEFNLDVDLRTTWRKFWRDEAFYFEYLKGQGDLDIVLGKWEATNTTGGSLSLGRSVECSHPVKVSFPGTPSHTRCFRRQSTSLGSERGSTTLTLTESMRFEGIPYSDYFTVQTVWRYVEARPVLAEGDIENGRCSVAVAVFVEVQFVKSTWLKGTISSNTESECREALGTWRALAAAAVKEEPATALLQSLRSSSSHPWFTPANPLGSGHSDGALSSRDGHQPNAPHDSAQTGKAWSAGDVVGVLMHGPSSTCSFASAHGSSVSLVGSDSASESEFFDIEYTFEIDEAARPPSIEAVSGPFGAAAGKAGLPRFGAGAPGALGPRETAEGRDSGASVLREALVVVLQFLWWQARDGLTVARLWRYFAPDSRALLRRLGRSLLPVCDCRPHAESSSVAVQAAEPDLYTPLMLVLSLAQVLLWCIDVTGDANTQHCRRETLLGTVLIVSLSSWLGASLFYYFISFLLGSRLKLVQSLTVTGYGFFGWCLGLVASQLLVLGRESARIDPEWALFAVGLPSGAALALVFSQSTPEGRRAPDDADASAHARDARAPTLAPDLHTHNSSVGRGCGEDGGRVLVRKQVGKVKRAAMWIWPKALCFVVILATHVELMRYVRHVIIPGEQQLCALWSGIRPEDFALYDYEELKRLANALKSNAPFKN